MKTMKLLMAAALLVGFSACSSGNDDDDSGNNSENNGENGGNCNNGGNSDGGSGYIDKINPSNVFTGDKPSVIGDIESITYDTEGRVSKMKTPQGDVTFIYAKTKTRSDEADVIMRTPSIYTYSLMIGSNGFASSIEGAGEYWEFRYTADGHLNYAEWSGRNPSILKLNYDKGGDLLNISYEFPGETEFNISWTPSYTSSSVPTPIENKGCIMLFFARLESQFEYAYYAGLLGKATKYMPLTSYNFVPGYKYGIDLSWTFNDNGYPTAVKEYRSDGDREQVGSHTFSWNN